MKIIPKSKLVFARHSFKMSVSALYVAGLILVYLASFADLNFRPFDDVAAFLYIAWVISGPFVFIYMFIQSLWNCNKGNKAFELSFAILHLATFLLWVNFVRISWDMWMSA